MENPWDNVMAGMDLTEEVTLALNERCNTILQLLRSYEILSDPLSIMALGVIYAKVSADGGVPVEVIAALAATFAQRTEARSGTPEELLRGAN